MGEIGLLLLCCFSVSDGLNLLAIVVNCLLTFYIVRIIQNNLTNKRALKDYLINEVKEQRRDYRDFLIKLNNGEINSQMPIPWCKLMNIRIQDNMSIVSQSFNVEEAKLSSYQYELIELITENDDFILAFKNSDLVTLSSKSKNDIIYFQQINDKLFGEIIVAINQGKS